MFGIKQKTEEWYNIRKKIITATDVAIILECNPYMKKSELLYNKINDITTVENNIVKWGEEYEDIIETSKCDWLDDLLTAVFVSHTKILTSINTNKNKNKINLQIPKVDFFVHQ